MVWLKYISITFNEKSNTDRPKYKTKTRILILEVMMVKFGISPDRVEYAPKVLIRKAILCERAGFDALWKGDHILSFNPKTY